MGWRRTSLTQHRGLLCKRGWFGHMRGRDRGLRLASPKVSVNFLHAGGLRLLPKVALTYLIFIISRGYRQDPEYYPYRVETHRGQQPCREGPDWPQQPKGSASVDSVPSAHSPIHSYKWQLLLSQKLSQDCGCLLSQR